MLAWNSWTYDTGWRFGMVWDERAFEHEWIPRIRTHLKNQDFPFPALMIQSYHPFGDNGSGYEAYCGFIKSWNQAGKTPRLKMITPRQWWEVVKKSSDRLPTHSGDWTDFWNFGCISSAREQAINRASRQRLRVSDALAAAVDSGYDPSARRARTQWRAAAWESVHLFDEHTWGADCAVRDPYCEDSAAQWHHKAHYAYQGRSLSHLLQRDGLAALARTIGGARPDHLVVFNDLPWTRELSGPIAKWCLEPRGDAADQTAGRHFQDRMAAEVSLFGSEGEMKPALPFLPPLEVPGFGYRVIPRDSIYPGQWEEVAATDLIENEAYRLKFDLKRGGVLSWLDKRSGKEWVDQSSPYPLHGFVHERVDSGADHPWPRREIFAMEWNPDSLSRPRAWRPGWKASRQSPTRVVSHRILRSPFGTRVLQELEAPGCEGLLRQVVYLPDGGEFVEFFSSWEMGLDSHPQANYLAFPLNIAEPAVRIDIGGQALEPERQQLPGTCRDYFTVHNWVDFHNQREGMTIATPDNPLAQLGEFGFGGDRRLFQLKRALFLGWVTNNYWETNFRAHQPGRVHSRYRLAPYRGGFEENRAHRFGREALQLNPPVQHLGESTELSASETAQFLVLPEPPVLCLSVQPHHQSGVQVRLLNASDSEQSYEISSGLLQLATAHLCDSLGQDVQSLEVVNGVLVGSLAPRHFATLRLGV